MLTTMRSNNNVKSIYETANMRGGTCVMERPETVNRASQQSTAQEDISEARARMQKNLDRLLNYDRYMAEEKAEENKASESNTATITKPDEKPMEQQVSDEDIRPTSTTMQFGNDIDQIREEMKQVAKDDEASYKLNKKGKVAVILYSLIVTVVLALIVLNTGVLASLNNSTTAKQATLDSYMASYNSVQTEIDNISNSDYISDIAENQYGMVRK